MSNQSDIELAYWLGKNGFLTERETGAASWQMSGTRSRLRKGMTCATLGTRRRRGS